VPDNSFHCFSGLQYLIIVIWPVENEELNSPAARCTFVYTMNEQLTQFNVSHRHLLCI